MRWERRYPLAAAVVGLALGAIVPAPSPRVLLMVAIGAGATLVTVTLFSLGLVLVRHPVVTVLIRRDRFPRVLGYLHGAVRASLLLLAATLLLASLPPIVRQAATVLWSALVAYTAAVVWRALSLAGYLVAALGEAPSS